MRGPTGLLIPPQLQVDALTISDGMITVVAHTDHPTASCPECRQRSARVHSRYGCLLADLPWCSIPVRCRVTVRRFRCSNPSGRRRIFAERLDEVATAYALRTERLRKALEHLAFALGGEAGARLARDLGLLTSPDSLWRVIRRSPEPREFPIRVCGVDDWAWRKGHRYGTILVRLTRCSGHLNAWGVMP